MASMFYRTVIKASLPNTTITNDEDTNYTNVITQEREWYLPLDYIGSKSTKSSSTIVSQPMQSGDTMSDHMYREPTTVSLSGTFALNGRNWNNSTYSDIVKSTDRLTSIETVFEYIKNNGILCTLITIESVINDADIYTYDSRGQTVSNFNSNNTRFITRNNMALTSITWTEMTNYVDFSFDFKEVIFIDMLEYDVDVTDVDLPNISSPSSKSLGTILAQSGALSETIIRALHENGYIENDFLMGLAATTAVAGWLVASALVVWGAVAATIGIVTAVAGATGAAATVIGATATIFPVGTIIAIAAVALTVVVGGIIGITKWIKKRNKSKKAFKLINGKCDEDGQRLQNLIEDVQVEINQINSNINIYQISDNKEQQVILSIGGAYYYIQFTKLTDYPFWQAQISDGNGSNSFITPKHEWCVCSSMYDMHENKTMWFKDNSLKYQVYLVNPSLSLKENTSNKEALYNVMQDLSTYSIWVSLGNVSDNVDIISDAISDAIVNRGFK